MHIEIETTILVGERWSEAMPCHAMPSPVVKVWVALRKNTRTYVFVTQFWRTIQPERRPLRNTQLDQSEERLKL